jgi:uncharacterized damage-inducible protein DinB
MARNNRWSNYRLHAACACLPPAEYVRDRQAFFKSIHGTLNHILLVDRFYLEALRGKHPEAGSLSRELYADLSGLSRAQREVDEEMIQFCDELREASLTAVIEWIGGDGNRYSDPVHVVLAHVFLHQIHHRGQVHNMLSLAGTKAPQLDEFLLSHDAPLREQEIRELGLKL